MSFGWSAGDIAAAIQLLVSVASALDNVDGAANDYRQTVAFLRSLTRTLQTLEARALIHSSYSAQQELLDQIALMKRPVEEFLLLCEQFLKSLGDCSKKGRHRHAVHKLQWKFQYANKAERLQTRITRQLQAMSPLLHNIAIEIMASLEDNIADKLREHVSSAVDVALESRLGQKTPHIPVPGRLIPGALRSHARSGMMQLAESELMLYPGPEGERYPRRVSKPIVTTDGDVSRHVDRIVEAYRLAITRANPLVASFVNSDVEKVVEEIKKDLNTDISRDIEARTRKRYKRNRRLISTTTTTVSTFLGILRCSISEIEVQRSINCDDGHDDGHAWKLKSSIDLVPSGWLIQCCLRRALLIETEISSESSINIALQTFNVIPDDSPIFNLSIMGDVAGIQNLFQCGLASARDVDSLGRTPLYYAAGAWQAGTCKFLLDHGAHRVMSKRALGPGNRTAFTYAARPDLFSSRCAQTSSRVSLSQALTASGNCEQIETFQTFLSAGIDIEDAMENGDFDKAWEFEEGILRKYTQVHSPTLWIFTKFHHTVQNSPFIHWSELYTASLVKTTYRDPGSEVMEQIIHCCDIHNVKQTLISWIRVLDYPAGSQVSTSHSSMARGLQLILRQTDGLHFLASSLLGESSLTTPTAAAMRRSRSFRRFRDMLLELGIDLKQHIRGEIEINPDGWTEETLSQLFADDFQFNYKGYDMVHCKTHFFGPGRFACRHAWITFDEEPLWDQRKNRIKNGITGTFSEAELQVQREWDEGMTRYVQEGICFACQRRVKAAAGQDEDPNFSPLLIHCH